MEHPDSTDVKTALAALDERLSRIERTLNIQTIPEPDSPAAQVDSSSIIAQPILPGPHPWAEEARGPRDEQARAAATPAGDPGTSGRFLGLVGVIFFILSAAFFIKLAVNSGWLTPERQLIGAFLFAGVLISAGSFLEREDAAYAGFLSGAGIVVMYLCAYGGHLYYGIYSAAIASIIIAAITIGSLYLFNNRRHDFFLLTTIVGTYLVPLLLRRQSTDVFLTSAGYFILWDILFCGYAYMIGRRQAISYAAYMALGVFQILTIVRNPTFAAVELQAVQFALFSVATAAFSIRFKTRLTRGEAWSHFLVLIFFYFAEYAMLLEFYPPAVPWIGLGFAGAVYGLYLFAARNAGDSEDNFGPVVALFAAIVGFQTCYLELLPDSLRPVLGLGLLAVGIFRTAEVNDRFRWAKLVLMAIVCLEYLKALEIDPSVHSGRSFPLASILFGALLIYGYLQRSRPAGGEKLLHTGSVQILAGLFKFSEFCFAGAVAGYMTSALWAAFALFEMVVGTRTERKALSKSASIIFTVVALKVLLVDISESSSLIRVIALMVVGAIIYVGGLVLRKQRAK